MELLAAYEPMRHSLPLLTPSGHTVKIQYEDSSEASSSLRRTKLLAAYGSSTPS